MTLVRLAPPVGSRDPIENEGKPWRFIEHAHDARQLEQLLAGKRTCGWIHLAGISIETPQAVFARAEAFGTKLTIVGCVSLSTLESWQDAMCAMKGTHLLWFDSCENARNQLRGVISRVAPHTWTHHIYKAIVPSPEELPTDLREFLEEALIDHRSDDDVSAICAHDSALQHRLWRAMRNKFGLRAPHYLLKAVCAVRAAHVLIIERGTAQDAAEFCNIHVKTLRRTLWTVFGRHVSGVRQMAEADVLKEVYEYVFRSKHHRNALPVFRTTDLSNVDG